MNTTCELCKRELAPVRSNVYQCENARCRRYGVGVYFCRRCYRPIGNAGEIIRTEDQYCLSGCAAEVKSSE